MATTSDKLTEAQIRAVVTESRLKSFCPDIAAPILQAIVADAPGVFAAAEINTTTRICHFLAQIKKETGGLRRLDESLHYTTAARLVAIFPSKFPNQAAATPYLKNSQKCANFVYAGRNGNGNVASGDGFKYRGSGLIQLTGRGNFRAVGNEIGVGAALEQDPESVRDPHGGMKVAAGYWTSRNINSKADLATDAGVNAVTKLINPHENAGGRKERRVNFSAATGIFKPPVGNEAPARARAPAGDDDYMFDSPELSTEPSARDMHIDRYLDAVAPSVALESMAAEHAPLQMPEVYWPKKDINTIDFGHIDTELEDEYFDLTPAALDRAIKWNGFAPEGHKGVLTIALRGCELVQQHEALEQTAIAVRSVRPDHVNYKCVIGFYYTETQKLTLYSGSTVPCPHYMKNYYLMKKGQPHSSDTRCNMLPTGNYVFRVANHDGIAPALRMSERDSLGTDATVTIVRTTNDLTFGTSDDWESGQIYDNIHCSYVLNKSPTYGAFFSSAGCLTVRGRKDPSDQWKRFQKVLTGLGTGKRSDLVLLTGKDLSIAAREVAAGSGAAVDKRLARLRPGSLGAPVKALQKKLDLTQSGYFDWKTKKTLALYQRQHGHVSDGIYSPALDAALGWSVLP